jgi:LysR family transcriptional regulator, regulator for genes of the gallate degradation pathway
VVAPRSARSPSTYLNIRHLELFREVVRRGSVSEAARAGHLSQPAVTQAVAGVESALGGRLFERNSRGLLPSPTALAVVERIARAIEMLRLAVEPIRARNGCWQRKTPVLRGITASQLESLIAATEHGGFARAARQIGKARASVHRAIRQLEHSLDAQLIEITSLGVRPTRDGEKLALAAQLAIAEIAQARAEVALVFGAGSGSSVIGAMPLARSVLVPRALAEFTRAYPHHAVSILDGPYSNMLAALRRGGADILIGALREPAPCHDIVQEHLFDDPLAIVGRAGHPLASVPAPSLTALAPYPWIAPRAESPLRRRFDTLIKVLNVHRPVAPIECSSLVAARAILLESDRLMLLSAHQIHHELQAGQLVALQHPLGKWTRSIGLTLRRDWRPTEIQARLIEIIRCHAQAFLGHGEPAVPRAREGQS